MKTLKTLLVVFCLLCLTLHSRQSQAAVGAIAAAPAVVVAGLYVAGTGAVVTGVVTVMDVQEGGGGLFAGIMFMFITGPIMLLGLLILDEEQALEFAPMEADHGRKLGLSSDELRAYNNEIDQINALAAFVDAEVSKDVKPSREYAAKLWTEVKGELSPAAFNGLLKVNNQFIKNN